MDRCKWRKMIKEARWSGWVWVGESCFWYRPTRVVPDQRPLNGRCCCCCCCCCTVVVYLANFDGRSETLGSLWRRTADTAGWFGGVDSDSRLVGVWPSEARELPGLGLSSVRDRSGDDVRAHTTGCAGSMTFASCFLISGSSLQHRCQQSAQCTLYNKHLSFSFCSVKYNKTNRLNQVPVSGFYMFSIFRLHCMHCADAAYCYTSHIAGHGRPACPWMWMWCKNSWINGEPVWWADMC